jgi:hypothetical protein
VLQETKSNAIKFCKVQKNILTLGYGNEICLINLEDGISFDITQSSIPSLFSLPSLFCLFASPHFSSPPLPSLQTLVLHVISFNTESAIEVVEHDANAQVVFAGLSNGKIICWQYEYHRDHETDFKLTCYFTESAKNTWIGRIP